MGDLQVGANDHGMASRGARAPRLAKGSLAAEVVRVFARRRPQSAGVCRRADRGGDGPARLLDCRGIASPISQDVKSNQATRRKKEKTTTPQESLDSISR